MFCVCVYVHMCVLEYVKVMHGILAHLTISKIGDKALH